MRLGKLTLCHPAVTGLKRALFVLTLWFVCLALYRALLELDWSLLGFRTSYILYGALLLGLGTLIASESIRLVYAKLGANIGSCEAISLFTIPSLGKYLPGKVFSVMGHIALARSYGVGTSVCSAAIGLLTVVGLAVPMSLGLCVLALSGRAALNGIPVNTGMIVVIFAVSLLALHPKTYKLLMTRGFKLINRPSVELDLDSRGLSILLVLTLVQTVVYLGGVGVVILGTLRLPISVLPSMVGAMCIANVLGFLALFAPGGIGVREGILLVLLAPVVGTANAGVISLLMRIIQTFVDLASAAAGGVALKVSRHKARPRLVERKEDA